MTEPRTEAGRALWDHPSTVGGAVLPGGNRMLHKAILAIEREAAASAEPSLDVDRLAEAMRAVAPNMRSYGGGDCDCPQDDVEGGTRCYGHDRRDRDALAIASEYARLGVAVEPEHEVVTDSSPHNRPAPSKQG